LRDMHEMCEFPSFFFLVTSSIYNFMVFIGPKESVRGRT
jgi:hypothetical protein